MTDDRVRTNRAEVFRQSWQSLWFNGDHTADVVTIPVEEAREALDTIESLQAEVEQMKADREVAYEETRISNDALRRIRDISSDVHPTEAAYQMRDIAKGAMNDQA